LFVYLGIIKKIKVMKNYIIVELVDNQISNRIETIGESFEDVLSRYGMDYEEAIDNEELEVLDGIANWQIEDMRIIVIQLL
jgi:hypothetical protein